MNITQTQLKIISYLLMFFFIIIILPLHLFSCFISGFLVYEIIISLISYFGRFIGNSYARWVVITVIISLIMFSIILLIASLVRLILSDTQYGINIITEANRIFHDVKNRIPHFFPSFFSQSTEELKKQIISLIESNLIIIHNMSHAFIHGLVTIFIGLIIGIKVSLSNSFNKKNTYFIKQLLKRLRYFSQAFRSVVFAQINISLVNSFLTSIIIFVIFPLFNVHLPLSFLLIILTFIFGLLPIIGNLISNFMIIISAFSVSLTIGGLMTIYLISIHKLEYFLNAKIIGNRIQANSWELLLAMLIFESIFGLCGLVAAPIYYAYLKIELRARHII